jgi:galactokinase
MASSSGTEIAVPQTTTIYGPDRVSETDKPAASSQHEERWKSLIDGFSKEYGHKPDFVARSPGRVNIIGEHVDYSLYNVFPMAVTVDVLVATRKVLTPKDSPPQFTIANTNPKYTTKEFALSPDGSVEIDAENHDWTNYFKAGLRGALEKLKQDSLDKSFVPASMQLLVNGNVPAGSGLSSSAAFVCASILAVMRANSHPITRQDLFDLAIVSEHAVGVYSGGMDQGASIFSRAGSALYIRFYPTFHIEHVIFPPSTPQLCFLVAQSFVTSNKQETAPRHYNLRVVEVTLAALVLAKLHSVELDKDISSLGYSLRGFQQAYIKKVGRLDAPIEYQVDDMIAITKDTLTQQDGYTREDISKILGLSIDELAEKFMSKFPVQADKFHLFNRSLHVFQEARRVLDFKACLTDAHTHGHTLDEQKLTYLGDLMNETQTSCRELYDCSCEELDEICSIARKAGTYGSRFTGAGWGGCTVHLVPEEKAQGVMDALKSEYYDKRFPDMKKEMMEEAMVISRPATGSFLYEGDV